MSAEDKSEPVSVSGILVWSDMLPMFPFNVTIGSVSIELRADGSWQGDAAAFLKEVGEMRRKGSGLYDGPLVWLVANAIRRDMEKGYPGECLASDHAS